VCEKGSSFSVIVPLTIGSSSMAKRREEGQQMAELDRLVMVIHSLQHGKIAGLSVWIQPSDLRIRSGARPSVQLQRKHAKGKAAGSVQPSGVSCWFKLVFLERRAQTLAEEG
jgi:hypothetical protein